VGAPGAGQCHRAASGCLLGAADISSASGLEPGALERALVAPVSAEGDGALLRG
jgi:hypothetical protein